MNNWLQETLILPEFARGVHLITDEISRAISITRCRVGLLHVFIRHTSASITINENASPEVRSDLNAYLDQLVPDGYELFEHTQEGADDMPAHVKASLLGNSLTVPVSDGRMMLGTWQGIYLCEHRHRGGRRALVLTLSGEFDEV